MNLPTMLSGQAADRELAVVREDKMQVRFGPAIVAVVSISAVKQAWVRAHGTNFAATVADPDTIAYLRDSSNQVIRYPAPNALWVREAPTQPGFLQFEAGSLLTAVLPLSAVG
jgi:hypothetical protein